MQSILSNLLAALLVIHACFGCCRQVVAGVGIQACCAPAVDRVNCCDNGDSPDCPSDSPTEAPTQSTCQGTCIYVASHDDDVMDLSPAELVACASIELSIAVPHFSVVLRHSPDLDTAPPLRLHLLHQILLI